MAKKIKALAELFHDTLKDIYFAENKILKTLPKMAKAANSNELRAAFQNHEKQTREQSDAVALRKSAGALCNIPSAILSSFVPRAPVSWTTTKPRRPSAGCM
jgi:ferritin-like metal-binding protein YciE